MRRNQLADRLLEKGYELVGIEKVGRANEFHVKKYEEVEVIVAMPTQTWEEFMKENHPKVRKIDSRKKYYEERVMKETLTIKEIAANSNVTRDTVYRWDQEEVKDGLLIDHGYAYFKLTPQGPIQVTYAEFVHQDTDLTEEEQELYNLIAKENKVTERDFKIATRGLYIRTRNYLVNRFTEKYQQLERALLESEVEKCSTKR